MTNKLVQWNVIYVYITFIITQWNRKYEYYASLAIKNSTEKKRKILVDSDQFI